MRFDRYRHRCLEIILLKGILMAQPTFSTLTPILFLLFFAVLTVGSGNPLEVKLTSGVFSGQTVSNGTERWLGIPYAHPPVGNRRFRGPVAIAQASAVLQNASTFGNACPQVTSSSLGAPMSEDCLYLNVSY